LSDNERLRCIRQDVGWTMGHLRRIKRACRGQPPGAAQPQADGPAERIDLDRSELEAILERAKTALSEEEYTKLHAAVETLAFLTQELEKKHVSLQRLKQLLFGATTETTRRVLQRVMDDAGQKKDSERPDVAGGQETSSPLFWGRHEWHCREFPVA